MDSMNKHFQYMDSLGNEGEERVEKLSSLIGKLNILVDELDRKSGKNN